ncbi:MAG TPA: hypothetical protein VHY37_08850 [Tepidisphaeraceae bacterium]|jgi:hypothetical protein|nr:hypothetical protein [Tepidisphaeraceae bacterium]
MLMLAEIIHPESTVVFATILAWILVAAVVIFVIRAGVRMGMRDHAQERPHPPQPDAGPGKFIIHGVDRQTKMDTTWHMQADSEANARVKADLEGIAVTSVQREV